MLKYSYKTELKRLETKKMALKIAKFNNPEDQLIEERFNEIEKQINWLRERIKNGQGLGVRTE